MDKQTALKRMIEIVRKYLGKEYKIYLFGSWAKGRALPTSDPDVGILGLRKIP